MSSSEGSNIYDDVDPMTPSSDDDYIPEVQVITSDSETGSDSDMDDFQPFAYLGDIVDDDVLAVPPPLNDIMIIGHPEGEHIVEIIPLDVLPLAMVPFVDLDEDDDDIVPVIPVEHIDDDLGDGDVYDVVILDIASPVVSVIDISSDADTDSYASSYASVTSSALQALGLQRNADLELDDVLPDEPVVPTPNHIASILPQTDHTDEAGPSGHAHIPPSEPLIAPHSPPHVMPVTDPYHPSHYPSVTTELCARVLTLEHQIDFIVRRVHELEEEFLHLEALVFLTPSPPAHSPPHAPPPPPPELPPLPPLPPQIPPVDLPARVLTLEQQMIFLHRLVHDMEDRVSHVYRALFPVPPPVFPPP
ncbi:myb-related transcription factor, partner of profilin-like [Helianthus annuus]|uniref:myb-related transcription factor, partner of profilin-like n=1 Tax=Helianthus annuus TaxID=4232 RepID=UPI000B901DD5|nr:myb-related transcription factor, partner of profilin-like [Helianthus annuus]